MFKVIIDTSQPANKLENVFQHTNQALIRIGKKPSISYIVEAYPQDSEFIVILEKFGNHVKDLLKLVYPNYKFSYTLNDLSVIGEKHLNSPFTYHNSQTIIQEPIPPPTSNWMGGVRTTHPDQYSFQTSGGMVTSLHRPGSSKEFLYINVFSVLDYKSFRKAQADIKNKSNNPNTIVDTLIKQGVKFACNEFKTWIYTGTSEGISTAREQIRDKFNNLDKDEESIYIFKKFVVKFFADPGKVRKRVARAKVLQGLVPKVLERKRNFFKYKYVSGQLYSKAANAKNFEELLEWTQRRLWKKVSQRINTGEFYSVCYKFYYNKTLQRIDEFYRSTQILDSKTVINGHNLPTLKELLSEVDFKLLSQGEPHLFHGDLILDNIIKSGNRYYLIDWRQDFGGLLNSGDIYYDLAKLNHNLTVNHDIVGRNLFEIHISGQKIDCDILRKEQLVICQNYYHKFLEEQGYDLKKVKLLTAIIWLNMSPLHHHPFNLFLYYFGKYHLWRVLKGK